MMKGKGNTASLLIGFGLIVFYFAVVQPRLGFVLTSPLVVVLYWVVVAAFVAVPLSTFLSERLLAPLMGDRGAKITREYSRARSLAAQGKYEEAIREFRSGLEDDPDNVLLRMEIAEIYSVEMKDFRQAICELEACLHLPLGETQGASILNRIADIYETNLGDIEAALAALRRITETWPGTKLAWRAQQRIEGILKEGRDRA